MDGKPELAPARPEDDEVGAVGGIWMIRTRVLCVLPEGMTAVAHVHGWNVPPAGAGSAGSQMLNTWEQDLAGLTDDQLHERLRLAEAYQDSSTRGGIGRNPKAARDWRRRRQAVEDELERRRPGPQPCA